jgi:hypothetical protein
MGYIGLLEFDATTSSLPSRTSQSAALASRRAGDLRVEGIFEGVRGGVLASLDRLAESRAAFDLADDLLSRSAFYQARSACIRATSTSRRRAAAPPKVTSTRLERTSTRRWRIEEARSLSRRSDDARMAIKLLAEPSLEPTVPVLVGPDIAPITAHASRHDHPRRQRSPSRRSRRRKPRKLTPSTVVTFTGELPVTIG